MTEQVTVQEEVRTDTEQSTESSNSPLIAEARRYRKRAQAAEKQVEELAANLADREKSLTEKTQKIEQLQQRRLVDDVLLDEGTIDLEAARLLTESALDEMEEPSVEKAVGELKRRKPYLFRTSSPIRSSGLMSPKDGESSPRSETMANAADDAAATGKRTHLLRYLRLKRKQNLNSN